LISEVPVHHLKLLALVPLAVGLVFLFFAIAWQVMTQFVVALGLIVVAGLIWVVCDHLWPDPSQEANI
jgi:hypothetical protein